MQSSELEYITTEPIGKLWVITFYKVLRFGKFGSHNADLMDISLNLWKNGVLKTKILEKDLRPWSFKTACT